MKSDTVFTHEEIINSIYIGILRRNAEHDAIVASKSSNESIVNILARCLASNEYLNLSANDFIKEKCSEAVSLMVDPKITVIQTADGRNYRNMLLEGARFNSRYCDKYEISYRLHFGVEYGKYSHHATFNRIYLLDELIRSGCGGWVFYLDADNLFQNKHFDLRKYIQQCDKRGKSFILFNHHAQSDPEFDFWNINAGSFAVKIDDQLVIAVIKIWAKLYSEFYSGENYSSAKKWGDIINDQNSLREILKYFDCALNIKDKCQMTSFSDNGHFIAWFGREEEDPKEDEIERRVSRLISAGHSIWPDSE